jgi:hypothetical protein
MYVRRQQRSAMHRARKLMRLAVAHMAPRRSPVTR